MVALLAMVPLVRLARDGSAMMAQAREQGADGAWAAELEQAEASRVAGDRAGEQRHYRAAVRAWRASAIGLTEARSGRTRHTVGACTVRASASS